jgi:hypothetical protein
MDHLTAGAPDSRKVTGIYRDVLDDDGTLGGNRGAIESF